jgi:ribonuclease HI
LTIRKITIYTDGAARGNPGASASGFMIYEAEKLLHKHEEYNGVATNNFAEYKAIKLSILWCLSNLDVSDATFELYSDNELAIRQLLGKYKIKSAHLKAVNEEINELLKKFKKIEFKNVKRENIYIKAVDRNLNILLDAREKSGATESI